MIYINCPTQQDYVIKTLEESKEGIVFKFDKKTGMKLAFTVDTEDLDNAVKLAKSIIKASPMGGALYFQATK
ncbi:MAG: hypothetical protein R3Y09_10280 [Clostridia bacterium]